MGEPAVFENYRDIEIVKRKLIALEEVAKSSKNNDKLRVLNIGSYDIKHPGHFTTLYFSKHLLEATEKNPNNYFGLKNQFGERLRPENMSLLVAMNSNESYKILNEEYQKKGKGKIATHDENERIWQVVHNESIDKIVLFDEMDAMKIIDAYKPHILTKGGDYVLSSEEEIIDNKNPENNRYAINQDEKKLVEIYGGIAVLTPVAKGKDGKIYHSYNHFVRRILDNHNGNNK